MALRKSDLRYEDEFHRAGDRITIREPEFIKYDTKVLASSVELSNRSLQEPEEAAHVLRMAREEMVRRLADQIYDVLEFEDVTDYNRDSVLLTGKISVNIRRR